MQIYLVGGAVRDRLLNLPVIENDWVVVGSTPEEMLKLGYKPVGKDFPVFLHPETHEEYALARTERKSGRGYTGFTFHTSPDVTLEEDLRRRDLTINAIAMTSDGKIIDPYGGQDDLRAGVLRHVSPAFVEDPVRILRVARFMARFHHLNFSIDENTRVLMKQMVEHGEVDALVPDRVWREFDGALGEKDPLVFFDVLDQCGALEKLFPEIKNHLAEIPRFASAKLPPFTKRAKETNSPTFQKGIDVVRRRGDFTGIRFANLLLSFAPKEIHELITRYPVPVDYKELALLANKQQHLFSKNDLSAEEILDLLNMADVWRRENRFLNLMRIFAETKQYQNILSAYENAKQVTAEKFIAQGLSGKALGEAIQQERLRLIKSKE